MYEATKTTAHQSVTDDPVISACILRQPLVALLQSDNRTHTQL